MTAPIPPVPRSTEPREWEKFLNALQFYLASIVAAYGEIAWGTVSKAGSNLTDIETRLHNNLQSLNSGDYQHLTLAQLSGLTGGSVTTLHNHSHLNLTNIGTYTHPEIDTHINNFQNVHGVGVGSAVVGTGDSQNITNKIYSLRSGATLNITAGTVTINGAKHLIDTEGGGAADDLDTISGGITNQILMISCVNPARVVTVKDGTGNISIGSDMVLSATNKSIVLLYDGSNWVQFARNDV